MDMQLAFIGARGGAAALRSPRARGTSGISRRACSRKWVCLQRTSQQTEGMTSMTCLFQHLSRDITFENVNQYRVLPVALLALSEIISHLGC